MTAPEQGTSARGAAPRGASGQRASRRSPAQPDSTAQGASTQGASEQSAPAQGAATPGRIGQRPAQPDSTPQGASKQSTSKQSAPDQRTPEQHPPQHSPRERMVFSAAQLIRRDGIAATGMREVAAHAQAPRGSLQHYFPGGKEQLVNEAVAWSGRYAGKRVARFLAAMDEPTPSGLFAAMVRQWTDEYEALGFGAGCPVAAATVDWADSTASTRDAAAAAFATWNAPVAEALTGMGVPATRSPALATLMISALEGALLIARAEQDVRALRTVARELGPMLDGCAVRT